MTKKLSKILAVFMAVVMVLSLDVFAYASSMKVSASKKSILTCQTTNLTVKVSGKKIDNLDCSFKSSNSKIASVNSSGVVTGVSKGSATITASYKGAKSAVKIKVGKNDLSTPALNLTYGLGYSYKDLMNANARTRVVFKDSTVKTGNGIVSGKSLDFSSSNKKIAYLDKTSTMHVKKAGTVTITVKKKHNPKMSLKLTVTVKKADSEFVITPNSTPLNGYGLNYSTYGNNTKTYFLLRSYLTYFESVGGGTLVLTKGVYTAPAALYVPSNVNIYLEDGAVLKKSTKTVSGLVASGSIFQFCEPSKWKQTGVYGVYYGVHDVNIIGEGNATVDLSDVKVSSKSNSDVALGFILCHNKDITIQGINFQNCYHGHFIELDASTHVTIDSCTFKNQADKCVTDSYKECINIDTPDSTTGGFNHNWAKMDSTPVDNIDITNCTFTNVQIAVGTHQFSKDVYHKNINFINNVVNGSVKCAIRPLNWKYLTITDCVFTNCATGSNERLFYINSSTGVDISNNTIKNTNQVALVAPVKIAKNDSSKAMISSATVRPTDEEIQGILDNNGYEGVKINYIRLFKAVPESTKEFWEFTPNSTTIRHSKDGHTVGYYSTSES